MDGNHHHSRFGIPENSQPEHLPPHLIFPVSPDHEKDRFYLARWLYGRETASVPSHTWNGLEEVVAAVVISVPGRIGRGLDARSRSRVSADKNMHAAFRFVYKILTDAGEKEGIHT